MILTALITNHIALGGCGVPLCAHSDQTVVEEEHAQGVTRGHQDVHSEVKLVTVDEERFLDVLLHDNVFQLRYLIGTSIEGYSVRANVR